MRALIIALVAGLGCGGGPGSDWQLIDTPADGSNTVFTVWAFDDDDVWLGGTSAYHYDGSEWIEEPTGGDSYGVLDFFAFGPDDLWAVSASAVYRWDGSAWSEVGPSPGPNFEALWRIWGTSPTDMWVANQDNSRVFHWDGQAWTQTTLQFVQVQALWGSGPDDIWLTGPFDTYRWNGSQWTVYDERPNPGGAWDMWGSASDDVWAVGASAEVMHFDGSAWSEIYLDTALGNYNGIWGSAADDVYAVGNGGGVAHYDGDSWSTTDAGFERQQNFTMIHGSSSTNIWATAADLSTFTSKLYKLEP